MKILKLSKPLSTLAVARLTQMAVFLEDLNSKVKPIEDPINQDDLSLPKGFNLTSWDCGSAACAMGWAAGSNEFDGLWLTGVENHRQPACWHDYPTQQQIVGWDATGIYLDINSQEVWVQHEATDLDYRYNVAPEGWERLKYVLFSAGNYHDLPTPGHVAERIRHLLTLEAT